MRLPVARPTGLLTQLLTRLLIACVLLALGAWTAVCALAVAPSTWGLALGLLATTVATVALPRGPARLGFCLGWVGVVGVVLPSRSEGDLVILADTRGWTIVAFAFVLLVAGVGTLPAPAWSRRRGSSPT